MPGSHHHFTQLLVLAVGAAVTAVITVTTVVEKRSMASTPAACTSLSVTESVSQADLILTGEVFLVVPADTGFATVLITPQRVYRGAVPPLGIRIRALAEQPTAGGPRDDLHFASNQPPYLLFLQQEADGLYRTSKCVGSRLLGEGLTLAEQTALGQ